MGQFYPDGIDGWMVKLDAKPQGGIAFDPKFFVERLGSLSHAVQQNPWAVLERRGGRLAIS